MLLDAMAIMVVFQKMRLYAGIAPDSRYPKSIMSRVVGALFLLVLMAAISLGGGP